MAEGGIALNDGEKILWESRPEKSMLGVWFFTRVIGFTIAAAFLTFWSFGFFGGMWAVATKQEQGFNSFLAAGQALIWVVPLCVLGSFGYASALRKTYRYFVTNQRLVCAGGLLVQKRRSVHYHKVTDVEVSRNFLEQLLGIRSLKIFTAGTSNPNPWGGGRAEIVFQGLQEADRAEQIINTTLKSYKATGE